MRRKLRGQTLVEAVFACFVTLTCALVFSATVPVANASRGKGERIAAATSIAHKQIEILRSVGYPNLDGNTLTTLGAAQNSTLVNLQSSGLTTSYEAGYESTTIDGAGVDSAQTNLPAGRSFVELTQVDIDLRMVTVVVFWQEKGQWRSVRVGTLVANM